MLTRLFSFNTYEFPALGCLVFHKVLNHFDVALPVVDVLVVLFLFPNDQYVWEEFFIVEILLTEMNFLLVNEDNSLSVIMCCCILVDFGIRLAYNGNDEIHEDHE